MFIELLLINLSLVIFFLLLLRHPVKIITMQLMLIVLMAIGSNRIESNRSKAPDANLFVFLNLIPALNFFEIPVQITFFAYHRLFKLQFVFQLFEWFKTVLNGFVTFTVFFERFLTLITLRS